MTGAPEWLTDYLRERIGLEPESLGARQVCSALKVRMNACACTEEGAYRLRLVGDAGERERLAAELSVTETWFFRDIEPFVLLAEEAARLGRPPRVLCAPCASGEEAYSAAIALRLRQIGDFWVDAIDLHPGAIALAQSGVYGAHSFRENGPGLPELGRAFFEPVCGGHVVCRALREKVRFLQGDLLAPLVLAQLPEYDFIFCRNLLIYLTPVARARLLGALLARLRPQGLLFTGHAELSGAQQPGLMPVDRKGAFALRKLGVMATEHVTFSCGEGRA